MTLFLLLLLAPSPLTSDYGADGAPQEIRIASPDAPIFRVRGTVLPSSDRDGLALVEFEESDDDEKSSPPRLAHEFDLGRPQSIGSHQAGSMPGVLASFVRSPVLRC